MRGSRRASASSSRPLPTRGAIAAATLALALAACGGGPEGDPDGVENGGNGETGRELACAQADDYRAQAQKLTFAQTKPGRDATDPNATVDDDIANNREFAQRSQERRRLLMLADAADAQCNGGD